NAWYACDEQSIEAYHRDAGNIYRAPTVTEPTYVRMGSSGTSENLFIFSPTSIKYGKCVYKYRLPDVSAPTDTFTVPNEYLDLLYQGVLARLYRQLQKQAESQDAAVEYEKKAVELEQAYDKSFQTEVIEKRRMHSNDDQN